MKAFIFSLILLATGMTTASAQNPEFYMVVRHYLNDQLWPHALYLGYDPTASDNLEGQNAWLSEKGGEQQLPPFFGDNEVRLSGQIIERDSSFGTGARIDIRHKPDSASFQLTYEIMMIVSTNFQYASMVWAPSAIPAIIKSVILEPATIAPGPARTKTDMKLVSEMIFPNRDSIEKYRFSLITFYYNRDHLGTVVDGKLAVKTLSLVSNPVSNRLSALVHLDKPAKVKLSLLDITGRMVGEQSIEGNVGLNPAEIDCNHLPNGAYKLIAFTGEQAYSQTVIVQK